MIREKLRKKWFVHAVVGLLLNGFGLSLLGEAIIMKSQNQSNLWILVGTLALIFINAGISTIGTAVKYRVHLDNAIQYKKSHSLRRSQREDKAE
ncbi:hypothetical protein JCM31826_09460 [Thermaurantimonas aggregans]|uniref:Uncharacterized protein n=1 Tax=Thermaurantimonas aggregans TaxID=2173829 RepID=A0A401XKF7_9FLAO|nr:hypothetical protein [Thermaurantimonas aggregans]MCX8148344.1 hypothetical protein [Thermaurantimonas aggregans]GCD77464.1 hypothetical protein JCM31826_09460 [Thermaurantimonas aggregans]